MISIVFLINLSEVRSQVLLDLLSVVKFVSTSRNEEVMHDLCLLPTKGSILHQDYVSNTIRVPFAVFELCADSFPYLFPQFIA